jgi:hypothetical protein
MNSGLQDAFNLAWKLALVCHGHCADALLDSYHAERRPVADTVMASGDAAEQAQAARSAQERSKRDATIRAVFTDPVSRHHEAVAEAELDIDYEASPIVLGDRGNAIAPGQRLPDQIKVQSAAGESGMLHHYARRQGHTAFLIGGPSMAEQEFAKVLRDVEIIQPVEHPTVQGRSVAHLAVIAGPFRGTEVDDSLLATKLIEDGLAATCQGSFSATVRSVGHEIALLHE